MQSTPRPGFTGRPTSTSSLPCTYDLDVAGAQVPPRPRDGEVPLNLLFSGTVFTRGEHGFGVEQIPWHTEADYRLPVAVWRDLMAAHFPGQRLDPARPGDARRPGPLPLPARLHRAGTRP